jgi:hypothetical protein
MVFIWEDKLKIEEAVKKLDNIFLKYKIKDEKNMLGFRNNFIDYVRTLNEEDLKEEYDKKEFLYEFVELQKLIGIERDILSDYTMMVATNSKNLKQCFTPFEATEIMARITNDINKNTFYDCAAGTGQTLITAYCDWCKKQKYYDDTLFHLVVADDLDIYNVHCLIFNFATRGINAQVYHRDTLTQEVFEAYICLYDKYGFSKIKILRLILKSLKTTLTKRMDI